MITENSLKLVIVVLDSLDSRQAYKMLGYSFYYRLLLLIWAGILKTKSFNLCISNIPCENVLIFLKKDRLVMKTTTNNQKRITIVFKTIVFFKVRYLKMVVLKTIVLKNDRFYKTRRFVNDR